MSGCRPRIAAHPAGTCDDFAQRVRQPIGDHFKVDEQTVAPALEEEFEDRAARREVQVEGPIDELELRRPARQQAIERGEEWLDRECAHRNVERRKTELAGERTAARGFDVKNAMRQVVVGIKLVRQGEPLKRRQVAAMIFGTSAPASNARQVSANCKSAFTRDHVIRQADDLLLLDFVTDFRPSEHDAHIRPQAFQKRDHLGRRRDIPNIDSESDHAWLARQNRLDDFERSLVDVELRDLRPRAQLAEIREQIAQSKRRVDVAGVERGEEDFRHAHEGRSRCENIRGVESSKKAPAGEHVGSSHRAAGSLDVGGIVKKFVSLLIWLGIAVIGAGAYATIAWQRDEPLNSVYILTAALCTYAIGYRFYSKWIAARIFALDDRRATPCEVHEDGRDFVKTNKWIVFGHHFAAISGPGPLGRAGVGRPVWLFAGNALDLIGVVLGGAVQDFTILFRVDAARWEIARANGEGGTELVRRRDWRRGDSFHHDHPARRARARCGQGARGKSRGVYYRRARRFRSPCSWADISAISASAKCSRSR
jgi:hypothetical protein